MVTGSVRSTFLVAALASVLGGCAVEQAGEDTELASNELTTDVASTSDGNTGADRAGADDTGTDDTDGAGVDAAPATHGLAVSVHTTLGFPEDATPTDPEHALIVKRQYVTSYDGSRKNPRWVSWELTQPWLGSADRSNSWSIDRDLATGIPQAVNSDFTNSGFQRGHLCPSADRTKNDADNRSTFVFTNAVPQTAQSNSGTWLTLENEERSLARTGNNHVFVIAGTIYSGNVRRIGNGVHVPTSLFKVVVVMQGDHPRPSDVTPATRVIAVEVPNDTSVNGNYRRYLTSLEKLEQKTGFHFLSDADPAVHAALAPQVDSQ
ncbi:MAG: DNA/RNA non-specific endonuclease [Labilithrix sp.]|nr:DNA/RNA non-specific endonuclease [Labilithrix sp.]MCW5811423.1 DNA/RNA non-specific endonuclease [Labilithrix sp.]